MLWHREAAEHFAAGEPAPGRLLAAIADTEQLEAELAAVRADAQAEVSSAAQLQAAARRDRLEADEAADAAIEGPAWFHKLRSIIAIM